MNELEAKVKALEARIIDLDRIVAEAHQKTDALRKYVDNIDDSYYGMMKNALRKYGVLKEFCETAGPIIIECDRALFPEKAIKRARGLGFVVEGDDKIN
jgi:hypothetical protein